MSHKTYWGKRCAFVDGHDGKCETLTGLLLKMGFCILLFEASVVLLSGILSFLGLSC